MSFHRSAQSNRTEAEKTSAKQHAQAYSRPCPIPNCRQRAYGMLPMCRPCVALLSTADRKALRRLINAFHKGDVSSEASAPQVAAYIARATKRKPVLDRAAGEPSGCQCVYPTCLREGIVGHGFCSKHWTDIPRRVRADFNFDDPDLEYLFGIIDNEHVKHGRRDAKRLRQIFPAETTGNVATSPTFVSLSWYDPDNSEFPPGINGKGWPKEET